MVAALEDLTDRVRVERIEAAGVPALVHDPGQGSGLLLLGHGGGAGKDAPRFVDLCQQYAAGTGLAVVCIDAVDHGERSTPGAPPGLPAAWHTRSTPQMVQDWTATAASLASLGPPVGYVGFSMGSIFGAAVVASMHTIRAAVFVVGGIPRGPWLDDPELPTSLLGWASQLGHAEVLMVNKTGDDLFPVDGVRELFEAVPGTRKRLVFSDGGHDDWPEEEIEATISFLRTHATSA